MPPGKTIRFVPNMDFYRDPSSIDTLPVDAFDIVEIKFLSMDDAEEKLCDEAVIKLGRMTGIQGIAVPRSDVSDRGLIGLAPLPHLKYIKMFSSESRGAFLAHLKTKELCNIRLSSMEVGDKNFKAIARYPALDYIVFERVGISDAGVASIATLKTIKSIDFRFNPGITDKSIDVFLKLPLLKELNLRGTSITAAGIMRLKPLALTVLGTPDGLPAKDMIAIKKAFANTRLLKSEPTRKEVDSDTETIFSPITRGRKL